MFLTNLCLFLTFAFAVFSYDQFKDLNGLKNDIPQWIIVPEDDHTCNLKKVRIGVRKLISLLLVTKAALLSQVVNIPNDHVITLRKEC